ncbi:MULTISPECIES: ATP-grasp domain-containing protein [unclassified Streptomyces]|uniref:ATP-grasp domain-containing protein n=1 Tax=unclassified Streptomyces TaxID=2593676 RepID=UPI00081DB10E|nr:MULTISPECIES: ATP-grasp domain-containing protein [unclassified Streptomyces]MYZ38138.1 ATP-grasp domain-containing protein [Streptomyces sp. SID4917]SCF96555.1 Phosphoribosylglycinamide synthetase, ATP-grasp (A) domain [Streptomyces sp. MnatMP-M17]
MTIAIVDGYSTGAALARRLRQLGQRCVHVKSQTHPNAHLARTFEADAYTTDLGYTEDLHTVSEQLAALGVTRVTAGSESGVTLAERLSLDLGLPANTAEQLAARRDKHLMAQAARAAGIATPRATVATSPEEAGAWFAASGLKEAVVKPLKSAGTDNVRFCGSAKEVEAACTSVLAARTIFGHANHAALVQERLAGTEYYVNTVSYEGHHRVAETWRYTKRVGASSTPVYDYEEPVAATTQEARILREFTFAVLDALGIRSSPAHTEIMLTDRGPVLIETGARLGGATAPAVVERYCGASQTALAASTLVNPQSLLGFDDTQIIWTRTLRNVDFVNHHHGKADHRAVQKIAALPSVVAIYSSVNPGELLAPTDDLLSSPGYAYFAAEERHIVERDYARLRAWEHEGLHTV